MKNNSLKGSLMLLIATIIWGTAFVFQEEAANLGSFTINGLRYILGGIVLIPLVFVLRSKKRSNEACGSKLNRKALIIGGISCGTALAVAANLQQFGIMFNADISAGDSGKAGFITAMYIIFVPLITCICGKRIKPSVIISVLMGVAGLYLISVKSGFSVALGDLFLLLCALGFSAHILTVDYWVSRVDAVALSCIQFFVVGIISLILALVFEREAFSFRAVADSIFSIMFLGVMSSGVAYTLQVLGQKYSEASVASLIMSLESLFALLAACIFYGKLPTLREALGCAAMLLAIFIVQTPFVDNAFKKAHHRVLPK